MVEGSSGLGATCRNGTQSPTAPDVWAGLALTKANGAGPLAEEGPGCLRAYLNELQWRTNQFPTQHLSMQTGVSVAGRLQFLLASVAWHGDETACVKFKVKRFCLHLGSAALTTWFELTKLRNKLMACCPL